MRRLLPVLLFATAWLSARGAAADEARAKEACGRGKGRALAEIACEIAAGLGDRGRSALVVGVVPTAEGKLAVRAELATRLAELVAGALGPGATAWASPETPLHARDRAEPTRPLVVVGSRLVDARVEVTANAYVGRESLWRRVRAGRAGPLAHAFATRELDAEIRSFLPAVPLVARGIDKARGADRDIVALACGDLDLDGAPEVALVGRRRVTLARVRNAEVVVFAGRALAELSSVAPSPLREPIATAWVPEPGVLELGLTDRTTSLSLDAELKKLGDVAPGLPWPGGGCAALAELGLAPKPEPCHPGAPRRRGSEAVDAIAGARVTKRDGSSFVVRATRALGTGVVTVTDGTRTSTVEFAGAELALGDLDGDGVPELVSSVETRDPSTDAVLVHSVLSSERPVPRFRVAVPTGVRALGVCPARASGMAPIVVATGSELWVIR